MAQTFLDAAQVDELVTMYIGGKTMREVAEHFGVTAPRSRFTCVADRLQCVEAS